MAKIYLGIDCGTTSIKCMAIDENGKRICTVSRMHPTVSPRDGWMEQDPDSWFAPALDALRECAAKAGGEVSAAAFSGHMSSPVFLGEADRLLYPCMTVGDSRCRKEAEYLIENLGDLFLRKTGNLPLPCFVAPKLLWFKDNEPQKYREIRKFVMAKDYLRYKMTGVLNTDITDAGNTLLYDEENSRWDMELIGRIGIKKDIFPEVKRPVDCVGRILPEIADRCGLPRDLPVFCGGADMACSQIGTGCLRKSVVAVTLSTSGQICMRVDQKNPIGYGKVTFHPGVISSSGYAMGSVFSGGLALNWCYQMFTGTEKMEKNDLEEMNLLAEQTRDKLPGNSGILFLPFLTGSGSPYFSPEDRGTFLGLSTAADQAAVFKAVMEGVSFNIKESAELLERMGGEAKAVYLSGGGIHVKAWTQILTDVLGVPVYVLNESDASTLGAALIALAGSDPEKNLEKISESVLQTVEVLYKKKKRAVQYTRLFEGYKKCCAGVHEIYQQIADWMKEGA